MSQPAHAERAHALLGASKAEQWINCPPSARLQEHVPDKRSGYADEGTAAHELSELILRRTLTPCNEAERLKLDKAIVDFKSGNQYYGPEMDSAVADYVDVVTERFFAAKARSSDAVILLEDRLDFTGWVPDGYGTGDVVIISDEVMEIIDLKYGKGVPVSAVGNPQLRLYGLGAWWNWNYLYSIREVNLTIVQPRLDSVSTDTLLLSELIEWAETVVKPAAALADAGEGDFKSGDHCRWCKVKATCRARADENMKALEYEFQDPALLSLEEVGSVLFVAEQLQAWAKDVKEYAFEQAKSGTKIPAWKLVEGRSNRAITDKEALKAKLIKAGYKEAELLKPQELLGIGDLETKVVGSKKDFAKLAGDLVIKPQGKPTLAPETDPRPEMNSVENDFAEENFEEAN